MVIGSIAYTNCSRRFVLITPAGKLRSHDVFAADVWFFVAGLGEPHLGQIVEFDVAANADGRVEGVRIRNPQLQPPPGYKIGREVERTAGAAPAADVMSSAAGIITGDR